jgi:transposase
VALKDKYVVRLAPGDRSRLEQMAGAGRHPARALVHARVLLKADSGPGGPGWDDGRIADALECGASTVARVRKKFAQGGLDLALYRKKPAGRRYRKLTGEQEARLVALACSPAPDGQARWTLKLLAAKLVELEVADVSDETVRRTLKKTP